MDLQFVRKALSTLKRKFPDGLNKGKDVKDEESIFLHALYDAKKYKVHYEKDLLLYFECVFLFGIEFDKNKKYQWAKNILINNDLTGEVKMNEIHNHIVFALV